MKATPQENADKCGCLCSDQNVLKEMKLLVKSERPRAEKLSRREISHRATKYEHLAVFAKRGKVDPKQYVTELSCPAVTLRPRAFAISSGSRTHRLSPGIDDTEVSRSQPDTPERRRTVYLSR